MKYLFCPTTMGLYIDELTGVAVGCNHLELTKSDYLSLAGQRLVLVDGLPSIDTSPAITDPRDLGKLKRSQLVADIRVTTASGKVFDGDEISQGRMARAILALQGDAKVVWVLADNTPVEVTRIELTEALALAGAAQAAVWVLPEVVA